MNGKFVVFDYDLIRSDLFGVLIAKFVSLLSPFLAKLHSINMFFDLSVLLLNPHLNIILLVRRVNILQG
jgi:hypothetical protein